MSIAFRCRCKLPSENIWIFSICFFSLHILTHTLGHGGWWMENALSHENIYRWIRFIHRRALNIDISIHFQMKFYRNAHDARGKCWRSLQATGKDGKSKNDSIHVPFERFLRPHFFCPIQFIYGRTECDGVLHIKFHISMCMLRFIFVQCARFK